MDYLSFKQAWLPFFQKLLHNMDTVKLILQIQ